MNSIRKLWVRAAYYLGCFCELIHLYRFQQFLWESSAINDYEGGVWDEIGEDDEFLKYLDEENEEK